MPLGADPAPTRPAAFTDVDQRLAFLQMNSADRERVRALAPLLNAGSHDFVEQFYKHLFAFEETAQFLRDPHLIQRLKQAQRAHFESMLTDEVDDAYVNRCQRVGDVHASLGVSPQMFLGAYNQYLQFSLRQIASSQCGLKLGDYVEQVLSLLKAIFLDIELALDAYFGQATRNLREALDLVFQANNELRQFAQLTSHDLKTPLATVANLCDEAIDEFGEAMPPEAVQLIDMAKQRTFRMSKMIDELLELSSSVAASDAAAVNMTEVITEVIDRLAPEARARGIELIVPTDLPRVEGNRVRLCEAFFNVISNAVKFIDKQPGRIVVSVQAVGDAWRFAIADNGPGIPQADLAGIFSPFRRLQAHKQQPGSGLGLHFARTLIEKEQGQIWAESQIGEGSVFYIMLRRPAEL